MEKLRMPQPNEIPLAVFFPSFYPPEKQNFAFPKKIRDWWMRVGKGKCQYEYNWHGIRIECPNNAEQVHHIIPESWANINEINPDEVTGLPLCKKHHSGGNGRPFEKDFSFHSDIGDAYREYHNNPNSFKEAISKHKEAAKRGEPFWNNQMDSYFTRKMEKKAREYEKNNPDDPKP